MNRTEYAAQYARYQSACEDYLSALFVEKAPYEDLFSAMRYSLLSGGKRIRPVLTLEFARLCGIPWQRALPVACALELVHSYSLIHDDLPCMDNDDLRRGKPTNHKVYGETMAILAGDALQPEAFRLILTAPELTAEARADCALILARAAGADGMVAGQVLDTLHHPRSREELTLLHSLKTGAMIRAAALLGCAAAQSGAQLRTAAEKYAEEIGLAFQIRDDMLDVLGNEATFGKPIGSDKSEGKVTFVDLLGMDGCAEAVAACTQRAKEAVQALPEHDFLLLFADLLAEREK